MFDCVPMSIAHRTIESTDHFISHTLHVQNWIYLNDIDPHSELACIDNTQSLHQFSIPRSHIFNEAILQNIRRVSKHKSKMYK